MTRAELIEKATPEQRRLFTECPQFLEAMDDATLAIWLQQTA